MSLFLSLDCFLFADEFRSIENLRLREPGKFTVGYESMLWTAAGDHFLAICREFHPSDLNQRPRPLAAGTAFPRTLQELLNLFRGDGYTVTTAGRVVFVQTPTVAALPWTPLDAKVGTFSASGNAKELNEALSKHIEKQGYRGGFPQLHNWREAGYVIIAKDHETYREFLHRVAYQNGICSRAVVDVERHGGASPFDPRPVLDSENSLSILLQ